MNMRLVQLHGKHPNLTLMKLAHWHRAQGDCAHITRRIYPSLFPESRRNMSKKFRPVRELWGNASDCFVSSDVLMAILEAIADETIKTNHQGSYFSSRDDEDMTRVWILPGSSFLEFVQSPEFSGPWVIDHMDEDRLDLSDIASVVGNMKALAPQWQALLDTDGSLRFYVDQV